MKNDFSSVRHLRTAAFLIIAFFSLSTSFAQTVTKQLYLSSPGLTLDRTDPVATADNTTASIGVGVKVSSTTTGFSANPNANSFTVSHTTGTGNNRLMLVGISQKNKLVNSVTYGGVALTLVGESITSSNARIHLYRLINPASGTANVVVNLSANPDKGIVVGVTTFENVDQTNPLGTFAAATGSSNSASVSVASAAGELVFDLATYRNTTMTSGSGQTSLYNINSGGEIDGGGSSTKPGAASVSMGWNGASSQSWAIGGISIKPATITFTQSPVLCSPLTIKAGSISLITYVSAITGTLPSNPSMTASLKHGATSIITLSSPVYNSGAGTITWTGTLAADITIPAGVAIAVDIKTNQSGVSFKLDYDSQTKPSKINLPVSTYINVNSLEVYNAAYPGGSIITNNTSLGGTTKYLRAVVSDPFGYDDITALNMTITPTGTVSSATSVATSGCTKTYEYVWTIPASTSNYSIVATAKEGYENTVTHSKTINHTVCMNCPPVAVIDSANGEGGEPLVLSVLANDTDPNNNINPASLAVTIQPNNGSASVTGNTITYLPNGSFTGKDTFTYQICDNTSPAPLCATAQVIVTIFPIQFDACATATKKQTYYVPFPEQDARTALLASSSSGTAVNDVRSIISLQMPYPNMTIVWDHWEDGYESNPLNPAQSTTKVWGDGNLFNGITPGYATDVIPAGGSIVLDNTMPSNPRVQANIFYDGRDKIITSGEITMTQALGEPSLFSVQAMKTNISSVSDFGKSFTIPAGQNYPSQDFDYTALFIRSSANNTLVQIDKDNNGSYETSTTLQEGQSYLVNGGVLSGASVIATNPIGVDLHWGGIDQYSSRQAPVYPATWYSNIYYSPVATTHSPDTAVVMLYNSLNRSISVNWSSGIPSSGTITLPAKTVVRFPLAVSATAAYKFENPNGESFVAIEIADSYTPGGGGNSGQEFDWAFNLISASRLTNFATVAWAPGSYDGTRNDNPIWVTPNANTTVYVKYDGNVLSGGSASPCGFRYDASYPLNALNSKRLLDPSGDNSQSNLAVYTCDGTKLAVVYGEDASTATPGNPSWDVGTTLQPICMDKLIFANDDYAMTLTNTPVTIQVLTNDGGSLATVDPTTVSIAGLLQASHGTVTVNANGTLLYTPTIGYTGNDTLQYQVCSTPSPIVCDNATVYITVGACPASVGKNLITGQVFLDKNNDALNNDGGTGFTPAKVYLYTDGNCNGTIDANELTDSVSVDASGQYQFVRLPEKTVADNFDLAAGGNSCATGSDGTGTWLTNWIDGGDGSSVGYCVTPAQSASSTDVEIVQDGVFGYALRLDDDNNYAQRQFNMQNATAAFLNFSFRRGATGFASGENVLVQMSTNGSSFTTIYTIPGNGATDAAYIHVSNLDVSAFNTTGTTYIRLTTDANVDEGDHVFIDNISISFLKYNQCYITRVDPTSIPSYSSISTTNLQAITFSSAATCISAKDFGIKVATLSGTVYNDVNGLTDLTVNGVGTNAGGLFAILVNASSQVVNSTPVAANGTYAITGTVAGTYTMLISTVAGTIGASAPIPSLPSGWVHTGEKIGTGTGNDGTINGISAAFTVVGTTDIPQINFGIQTPPSANTATAISQVNPGGTAAITMPATTFGGTDLNGGQIDSIKIIAFPTNATSIIINGISYTSGTFPANGVRIPTTTNGQPTQTIQIDPIDGAVAVVISYVTIDNARFVSATTGTATLPFTTVSVSGNVFNDVDGMTNNIVDGNGTDAGGLHAILINNSGFVSASVAVSGIGNYIFSGVNGGNYTVRIRTTSAIAGSAAPNPSLPSGWVYTGELNGTGMGSDALANGISASFTVTTGSVSNINFGIEEPPVTNSSAGQSFVNPGGTVSASVPANIFGGTDFNGGEIDSIKILSFPTNATSITINGINYTNATFPSAGVRVPTNGDGEPTQSIVVDPFDGALTVVIQYLVIDNAWVSSPVTGLANVSFVTASIEGTVFDDGNGLSNNQVDGIGTNAGGLHAIAINDAGIVMVSAAVNTNGIYLLSGLNGGNYRVLISTIAGVVGNPAPAPSVPGGWIFTGEQNGGGSGGDGSIDGISAVIALTSDIALINFGIEKLPTAVADIATTNEDTPVTFSITGNDTDLDGTIDVTSVDLNPSVAGQQTMLATAQGSWSVNAFGNVTFTPLSNYSGTATINYTVKDNYGALSNTAIITVNVIPVNDPPVANNDNSSTNEDTPVTFNITNNDTDVDGTINTNSVDLDPVSVGQQTNLTTAQGSWNVNASGNVTFTPVLNFNGNASITYTVNDNSGATSNVATITVNVIPVNDPPVANNDNSSTNEDTPVTFNITNNDTDVDGTINTNSVDLDPVTVGQQTNLTTAQGSWDVNASGNVTFTPLSNYNGIATINYTVNDNSGAISNVASITVTVTPVNDPPVVPDTTVTTPEDTPITICIPVTDVDGISIVPSPCGGPSNGTINGWTVQGNTVCVTYTPSPDYNGTDNLCVIVCDGGTPNLCDTSNITITVTPVNDPPVVPDTTVTTPEDTPITICIPVTDVDGISIVPSPCGGPSNGTINGWTVQGNTVCVTYTPSPDYNGTDNLCVIVCDGGTPNLCDTSHITITVTPVNDPPVVPDTTVTTPEDTPITICIPVTDVDGISILPSPCGGPSHGTINGWTVQGNTVCVTYTPSPDYNGTDNLCVIVCDGGTPNLCDTSNITITVNPVNDPPVVPDTTVTTPEDTPITICIPVTDVDGISIVPSPCGGPSHGTINGWTVQGNTVCVTYTPSPDYNGTDNLCVIVCDGGTPNLCDTSNITITVTPVNDPPVVPDTTVTTPEDTPITICIPVTDVDGISILPSPCGGPSNGTINGWTVQGNTVCVTYTPSPDYNGTDNLCVIVCDGGTPNLCDTSNITITVTPVNDPPVVPDTTVTTPEDTPITICIPVTDVDGISILPSPCGGPSNGTINGWTVQGNTVCVTYTPSPDYNGTDNLCVIVCDGGTPNLCDTSHITITVTPVNDPPVVPDTTVTTPEDTPITICIPVTDVDGISIVPSPCGGPSHGTINGWTVQGNTVCVTYTPSPDYNGTDNLCVIVCDGGTPNLCDTSNITITVTPVNDPPVVPDTTVTTPEDTPITICIPVTDVDGISILPSPCGGPSHGTINGWTVQGNTVCVTYTPSPDYNGTDNLCVIVCDGGTPNLCDTSHITITVTPVNDPPVVPDTTVTTPEDTPITICIPVTDVDGISILPSPCGGPSHGTINGWTVQGNTVCVTYTPSPDYNGTDNLCVIVCDGGTPNLCDTSNITITVTPVNDPPVVPDTTVTTPEDTPITICIPVTDVDGISILPSPCGGPSHGTINGWTVQGNTVCVTYTPSPDYNGTDNLCVIVCDGGTPNLCDTSNITITVTPVNDPPVANNDQSSTNEDTPVTFNITNNDTDLDGTINTSSVDLDPIIGGQQTTLITPQGIWSVNNSGDVTFNPALNFNGVATTNYVVHDNNGASSNVAVIKVIVADVATVCDSYLWNGATYTTSGTYTYNQPDGSGGFDTLKLVLTVHYSSADGNATVTACDSYIWNGNTYTASGTYTFTSLNAFGCTNTATLTLGINHSSSNGDASATACGSYTWNGVTYTTSGVYTYTTLNTSGCINTATLTLTINSSTFDGDVTMTACDAYTWNSTTYTATGVYTYSSMNTAGCINIATLHLTINSSTYDGDASITVCDSYTWNGMTYTVSGVYTYTSLNASSCINTATLTLTIHHSSTDGDAAITACDSYTWNGTTYTASGVYTYTSLNASSCVNTATLTLTINHSSTNGNATVTACDSYTWNGVTYSLSGTYTFTSLNSSSCINTATLILTVNYSSTNGGSTTVQCNFYTWNGSTYTESGVYTHTTLNATNCVNTATLNLTIKKASFSTLDQTACNSFIWSNGVTYTATGSYTYTTSNAAGCDSILTLNLTMNNGVNLTLKAILEGAYDISTGLMKDSLRQASHCPSSAIGVPGVCPPVNVIPSTRLRWFNNVSCANDADTTIGGGNAVIADNIMSVSGPDAIVDWVFVEIRSGSNFNTVVATKSALIQRDGDIVSCIDGVSPLYFSCVCPGNYYLTVKHRNHLGVMTGAPVALSSLPASFDFTEPSANVWVKPGYPTSILNTPRHTLGTIAAMWAGDANTNKNSKYNGTSNDKEQILYDFGSSSNTNDILYQVYKNSDLNMDGKVKYNNSDNDKNWLLNLILVSTSPSTPNTIISQHTPN